MRGKAIELTVGLLVIAAIASFMFLAIKSSGLSPRYLSGHNTYTVTAEFSDIGGLKQDAAIRLAGVHIGYVDKITLDQRSFKARVRMAIYDRYDKIPADTSAAIQTSGLLGENYVSLSAGGSLDSLQDGSEIHTAYSATNLGSLIQTFASKGDNKQ